MTMTDEEICRDYRTAKAPMKQIGILADLNQCGKDRIKQILIDGGCKLPGNMTAPGEKKIVPPKAEQVKRTEAEDVISVSEALPLLAGLTLN